LGRLSFVLAALAGIATVTHGYLSVHPHPFEKVSARALRLSKVHGIAIQYGDPSTFFVAPFGPSDAIPSEVKMTGASPDRLGPALDGIELALDRYPPGFVATLVRAIFIAGDLRVNAEHSGGFTGPAWFVLAASDSVGAEAVRLNALEGVHHELSSFVLKKANLVAEWTAFAPKEWKFTTHNEVALANGAGPDPAPDTGFLSAYAATTAENDFNTYAERAFSGPKTLAQLACKHPLIQRKLHFMLQSYVQLDARMERVFGELGLSPSHLCGGS
jgi:hypothetical protein